MYRFSCITIVQMNIERSRHSNEKLMQCFVCMAASCRTTRDIVKIIDALYIKRDMAICLYKSQIAAQIINLWQLHDFALINHAFPHSQITIAPLSFLGNHVKNVVSKDRLNGQNHRVA